jgi:hypothetical protein
MPRRYTIRVATWDAGARGGAVVLRTGHRIDTSYVDPFPFYVDQTKSFMCKYSSRYFCLYFQHRLRLRLNNNIHCIQVPTSTYKYIYKKKLLPIAQLSQNSCATRALRICARPGISLPRLTARLVILPQYTKGPYKSESCMIVQLLWDGDLGANRVKPS